MELASNQFSPGKCHSDCLLIQGLDSSVLGAQPLQCNFLNAPSNSIFLFFPRHCGQFVETFYKPVKIERFIFLQDVKISAETTQAISRFASFSE
jgi:hypothetical protein